MPTSHYNTRQPKTTKENRLNNSNDITLNKNTQHVYQTPTSPNITALADLRDCTSWKTIPSLTSDHLLLLTTLIIHHKTTTTLYHFKQTTKNPIKHH